MLFLAGLVGISATGCSGSTSEQPNERVAKTAQALDPRQVITPTSYTVAISEVDVLSAVEPTYGICRLWTPDTGYVDWAELGVQVNASTPVAGACTLTDSTGSTSAATGAVLTQCGTSALQNNNLFTEGGPLQITFSVSGPNDVVRVGLALDNIESNAQNLAGSMQQTMANGLATAGDTVQAVGNVLSTAGGAVALYSAVTAPVDPAGAVVGAVVGVIASIIGSVGGGISIIGDQSTGPGPNGAGYGTASSCAGGLVGNPVQSATSTPGCSQPPDYNGCVVNDLPPPDTMWFTFTPAQLEQLIAQSAGSSGTAACLPGACNAIDIYPQMTGLGPPSGACYNQGGTGTEDTIGDQGFPGSGPAFDYGCSSSLHVRLTITRNWATGPAASAKSPDLAAVQTPNVLSAVAPNPANTNYQLSTYWGAGSGVQFNGFMPLSADGLYLGITPSTIPAVVSRTTDSLDAFYVAGGFLFAASNGPTTDYNWQVRGFTGVAPDNATVTAASRASTNLDVFLISSDGNVYDTYWYAGTGWTGSPFNVTTATCYDSAFSASTNSAPCIGSGVMGGGIASVSLNPWNVNVFYVGNDGGIWNSWWAGSNWSTWEIFGPSSPFQQGSGVAPPGGSIAATARSSGNIDVFYVDTAGNLWTSSWQNGGGWASWKIPAPAAGLGVPGAAISAVARQPGAIDVIFEGAASSGNGIEWATYEYPSAWQFETIPMTAGQTPNQQGANAVSIVAPTSFSLQAFYLNTQGNLATMTWADTERCDTMSGVPCDSVPTDIAWSAVQQLPAQ
jgi:hypothetical protein